MDISKLNHAQRSFLQHRLRAVTSQAEILATALIPREGHKVDGAAIAAAEGNYRRELAAFDSAIADYAAEPTEAA